MVTKLPQNGEWIVLINKINEMIDTLNKLTEESDRRK